MATRGSAILITKNEVHFGPTFNGDMFESFKGGHIDEFANKISEVENEIDFIKANNSFNKHHHNYEKIMSRYNGKFPLNDFIDENGELDYNKLFKITCDDYIVIKNISDNTYSVNITGSDNDELVHMFPTTTAVFNFSDFMYCV